MDRRTAVGLTAVALLILLLPPMQVRANPGITSDFVTLDSCDDPSAWTPIGDGQVSLNTIDYKQGTGAININKTGTTTVVFGANRTISSTNFRDKVLVVWFYFDSQSTLNKLVKAQVRIYDSSGNYAYFNIANKTGWQAFRRIGNSPDGTSATAPDYSAIVKIQAYFESRSASDTIPTGSIVMDFWHLGYYVQVDGGTFDAPIPFSDIVDWDRTNAMGLLDYTDGTYIAYWRQLIVNSGALSITNTKLIFHWNTENALYVKAYAGLKVLDSYMEGSATVRYGFWTRYDYAPTMQTLRSTWVSRLGGVSVFNSADGYVDDVTLISPNDAVVDGVVGTKAGKVMIKAGGYVVGASTSRIASAILFVDAYRFGGTAIGGEWGKTLVVSKLRCEETVLQDVLNLPTDLTSYFDSGVTNYHSYVKYSFNLRLVDQLGNPIPNATVILYDKNGNQVFKVTTNSNGDIPEQIVTTQDYLWDGSKAVLTDYNPYLLHIELNGVKQVEHKLNLYNPYRATITTTTIYNAEARVKSPYYLLNENAIIEFIVYDWNQKPITGLAVNAYITKPDNSIVGISLKDDGIAPDQMANDGTYTGQFNKTDEVGTYFVKVNTTIYGNVVTARTSFDVGKLEQKIASVNQSIISKLSNINLSIITQLGKVNVSLSDLIKSANLNITNLMNNVNTTLADLIRSSNLTIIRQILNSTGNITVYINGTRVGLESRLSDILKAIAATNSTLEGRLSDILGRLRATSTRGTISLPAIPSPSFLAFANLPAITVSTVVMALLVFLFGILLYKKYREGR
jgi:hypothetical protein